MFIIPFVSIAKFVNLEVKKVYYPSFLPAENNIVRSKQMAPRYVPPKKTKKTKMILEF